MTRTALGIAEADVLRKGIQGDVLLPADPGYDEARTLWNGSFDRRPAVVVRALGAADVSAAIQFARQNDLEIAVRGGGHSTAGLSSVDDGLMIDLSLMNSVETDVAGSAAAPRSRSATSRPSSTGWPHPPASSGTRGSAA
jgi:FAD/FMN-containing dehydrogenase